MSRRGRILVLGCAIAATGVVAGCSGDDGDQPPTPDADASYVVEANALCHQGLRAARRIGRTAQQNLEEGSDADVVTQVFVAPGIELLERQARRMRRIEAPPEATDFHTYVELYDPAIELVRQRIELAERGELAEAQNVGEYMDDLAADSRAAARRAGLDECDVDFSREIVGAAAGAN